MKASPLLTVIYDGQCDLCVHTLNLLLRLDLFRRIGHHDMRDPGRIDRLLPRLKFADLESAICLVTETGEIFRGFFAFRRLAWTSPWLWPLLALLYFPGAKAFGPHVYTWVARNRGRFACESASCAIASRLCLASSSRFKGVKPV